jgi:hypothetical protein
MPRFASAGGHLESKLRFCPALCAWRGFGVEDAEYGRRLTTKNAPTCLAGAFWAGFVPNL